VSELPIGWIQTELDNLLSFVIGGDWGKEPNYLDEEFEDVYCIRGTEFKNWRKEKGASAVHRRVKSTSLEKRELLRGDILIEISGGGPDQPVGRTLLIDQAALNIHKDHPKVCTNFVRLARPHSNINSAYLNYYLHSFYLSGEVKSYQGGSNNLRNLKFKDYSQISIPTAPLNEQTRIADKLDSMLAKVDAAQARLDKIPNILKRFRQSVLAAATSGDLTKEWRQCKFSKLLLNIRSGSGLKPNDTAGIPILRSSAVRNLVIDYTDYRLLNEDEKIKIDDYLETDDLMFTRLSGSHEYVGNCARVNAIKEHSIQYPDRLFRAKLEHPEMSYFLELYFCAPKFRAYIGANLSSSAGHQRITIGVLKEAEVVIPSIEEQKEIVRRVGYLFALANTTEKQYLNAKAKTNRLTQSILAKAFRGELVAQDSNDESAELLLRKIQQVYKTDVKSKKKK
jgi:type I restriction enzyme S subunit